MNALAVGFGRKCRRLLALAVVAGFWAAPAAGQDGMALYEEELRVELDQQRPGDREVGFDAGGWFTAAFFHYDDAALGSDRPLRRFQLRLWGRMNVQGVHRAYVRGLASLDDWNKGDNPVYGRGDESDTEIERLWYEINVGQALWERRNALKVKAGRQYAQIGTALTLSLPLDMVQVTASAYDISIKAFLGQTIRDSNNIDSSANVARHQERVFAGLELAYEGFDRHRPFIYVLNNKDETDADPPVGTQSFNYSSRYVGIGSKGALPGGQFTYQVELVGEWGKTYSETATTSRDRIRATALDLSAEYVFTGATTPKVIAEYIYATGDSDHRLSSSSTIGGNLIGTKDHAFNAFGYRDTGLAFAPRMSNIHMFMVGGSFYPLEHIEQFEKMEIGSKVFLYRKDAKAGPTSDTTATNNARFLGSDWDVFCNWRLTSDLAWTVRYGVFFPGSAYDGGDKTCRQFFYTGVVLSF